MYAIKRSIKNYSDTVRKKILDVIQTSSIDEFARSANLNPSLQYLLSSHLGNIQDG
jgi:hypothetical protein